MSLFGILKKLINLVFNFSTLFFEKYSKWFLEQFAVLKLWVLYYRSNKRAQGIGIGQGIGHFFNTF